MFLSLLVSAVSRCWYLVTLFFEQCNYYVRLITILYIVIFTGALMTSFDSSPFFPPSRLRGAHVCHNYHLALRQ